MSAGASHPSWSLGMPQPEQMIEQGGGQESALAKLLRTGAAVTLRQRRAVLAHQQSHVAVAGAAHAQGIQHHELARRIGEMVVAAQHLGDSHDGIIDGIAKEERGAAVVAPDDEIADVARQRIAAAREPTSMNSMT